MAVALKEIPTLSLLYKLGRLKPPAASPAGPHAANATYNAQISTIRTDITKLEVDAIVNAANNSLLGGGGVDGAIHAAAGPALLRECEQLHGCDTGDAKITGAHGRLRCKAVIHAVGPVYHRAKAAGQHTALLQGCYRRSLELAVQRGLRSIAFAALSTGIYGYPSGEAAEAALAEVRRFLDAGKGASLQRIVFCNFMEKDELAYHHFLPQFFPPTEADLDSPEDEKVAAGETDTGGNAKGGLKPSTNATGDEDTGGDPKDDTDPFADTEGDTESTKNNTPILDETTKSEAVMSTNSAASDDTKQRGS